ncbi:hypothetical protein [Rubrivivax gelatinosus]|uniref:hypothetical protein n=1 Tax=Rubrivivax gelatinosus TaxID=28068 RepID=UPI0005C19320|nr:hypothetical protein [Rubrivivax gelatinosus]MBG6083096.1 hypothetical protein [Rubrivivax gelatinosus]
MFLFDNYELHIVLLLGGWVATALGLVYVAPLLSSVVHMNIPLGLFALSVYFGREIWRVVKKGPEVSPPSLQD